MCIVMFILLSFAECILLIEFFILSKKIVFGNKRFDCAVFLNGELPENEILKQIKGVVFIAADGAANKVLKVGIKPDYIIGDLDSLDSEQDYTGIEIIRQESQVINDFEKILRFAEMRKDKDILIFGFHGGELEHTLNNWSVFIKFQNNLNMVLFDSGRYAIPVKEDISFECRKDEMISLVPQFECVLKTKNLEWNLHDEQLRMGKRKGCRNIARDESVEIELMSGQYLLFIDSRFPFAPEFV